MNQTVYKTRVFLFTSVMMLTTFSFTGIGCRVLKRDKQTIADKKAEEADKKVEAEYEKARKQHYAHQNKETKKMMKRTKKQAAKYNEPRKRKLLSSTKCK